MRSLGQNPTEAELADLVENFVKQPLPGFELVVPKEVSGDEPSTNKTTIDFLQFLRLMSTRC